MKKLVDFLFERLRIKHFLIVFVLSLPLSAYLLRQSNLKVIELRDKVLQIDEETGDIKQIEPHLQELRSFTLTHMNTDVGVIELPGTFNTAVEKLRLAAEKSGTANGSIYAEAQSACEDPFILLTARAQCVQDFVLARAAPGTDPVIELDFPDKNLFAYSFASPKWSPDVAGFSVLLSLMSFIVSIFLVLTRVLLPLLRRVIDRDPLE